jgi:hypothetical protein
LRQSAGPLAVKLKSLEQSHGPVVAEIRDRVQLRDPPAASGGSDHAASRLGGVTLTDVLGQQRKAKIGVSQEIALDEAADSNSTVRRRSRGVTATNAEPLIAKA